MVGRGIRGGWGHEEGKNVSAIMVQTNKLVQISLDVIYLSPVALSCCVLMTGVSMGMVPAACMALYCMGVT